MPVEHGFRPRPIGQVNLSPDGVGGGSRKGKTDRPFTLLPGNIPLGEPIVRRRPGAGRRPEQATPSLGQEITAYLDERTRLRTEGLLPTHEGKRQIITPADAISIDLLDFALALDISHHPENTAKFGSVGKILWGFNALAFGRMSQGIQEKVTLSCEFGQGFFRNHPQLLEDKGQLNGEQAAIVSQLLQKIGLPLELPQEGITIPYAQNVVAMRKFVGGEPLWEIPAPGEVPDDISRYR